MAVIMRYLPAHGLAVYETPNPAAPDDAPMIAPRSYTDRVKFHSDLEYLTVAAPFDVGITLPAVAATAITVGASTFLPGGYHRGTVPVYTHGRGSPPYFKGMLVNYLGANRSLNGTFVTDKPIGGLFNSPAPHNAQLCRMVELAVDNSQIIVIWRAFVSSGSSLASPGPSYSSNPYPALNLTVRLWLFDWNLDGPLGSENPALPMLKLTASDISVGRGKFDTAREYIRTATGAENNIMTTGDTMIQTGSGASAWTSPPWGWRYAVDGYAIEGQGPASGFTAAFTRVDMP